MALLDIFLEIDVSRLNVRESRLGIFIIDLVTCLHISKRGLNISETVCRT